MNTFSRLTVLAAVALFGAVIALPNGAIAIGTDRPTEPPQAEQPAPKEGIFKKLKKKVFRSKKKEEPKKQEEKKQEEKKSEQDFLSRYRVAYDLIYGKHDYASAITALHALGHDEHPDVANLVGFASRKLGDYDAAKVWYEKALAADPNHTRTWQYYGLWHLEQGNRLKAEDHLEKIAAICGTTCEDYKSLKLALASGKVAY
jgi:tetratricopeptide (TPR) repeat protein